MKRIFLSEKGSTLIESLLALTFAVVIITAVVIAVTTALSNSTFTKNQNLATQYAQEGLDIARYMKTSDYVAFRALNDSVKYCPTGEGLLVPIDELPCNDIDPENDADNRVFIGSVSIDHSGGNNPTGGRACQVLNSTFVTSEVSWTDAKCTDGEYCHKVSLNTCLSDLEQLANP